MNNWGLKATLLLTADGEEMIVRRTVEHPPGSNVDARLVYTGAAP